MKANQITIYPMLEKIWPFGRQVLKVNLILSSITSLISMALRDPSSYKALFISLIKSGVISFLTVGFLSGILYFEYSRKHEYYFYYNLGFSKLRLILLTFLLHFTISIPLMIIALYVSQI